MLRRSVNLRARHDHLKRPFEQRVGRHPDEIRAIGRDNFDRPGRNGADEGGIHTAGWRRAGQSVPARRHRCRLARKLYAEPNSASMESSTQSEGQRMLREGHRRLSSQPSEKSIAFCKRFNWLMRPKPKMNKSTIAIMTRRDRRPQAMERHWLTRIRSRSKKTKRFQHGIEAKSSGSAGFRAKIPFSRERPSRWRIEPGVASPSERPCSGRLTSCRHPVKASDLSQWVPRGQRHADRQLR